MEHLKLPTIITGQVDIARVQRELDSLDDFFTEAKLRTAGTSIRPPKISRLLDQLSRDNKINLLEETGRRQLMNDVKDIMEHAPRLHISFASEPSPRALEQVLVWLRRNIHPHVLLQIGLQPTIAAGCILRTPNKVFDMSLRANLNKQIPYLSQLISGAVDGR